MDRGRITRSTPAHPPPVARAAETVETRVLAGTMTPDENGGMTGIILTPGRRFYVVRVAARTAEQISFVVTKVHRSRPDLRNPLTGEPNHVYVVRMERRQ
jgi:hypothetical protein